VRFTTLDALLLLMAVIWGANYSIVKSAFAEIDPQAFNAVRMMLASAIFLTVMAASRLRTRRAPADAGSLTSIFVTPEPITRRDWAALAALGLVGHCAYQFFFIGGLARTSVANSSLMLAATPVVIALISALLGIDRVGLLHWMGAGLSMLGIYIVIGGGFSVGGPSLTGDLMMAIAVACWASYTIGSRPLMTRHSPVGVTGLSMTLGTLMYAPWFLPRLARVRWSALSTSTWLSLGYSAFFALCVAYTIWYAAVRQIGSARTSVYSNLVPIVAMVAAVAFLGEPLSASKIVGAAAVLTGVALTRVGRVDWSIFEWKW
jgi:drug/metabolite transporter (DMT)-like permease